MQQAAANRTRIADAFYLCHMFFDTSDSTNGIHN
jgi:hypothetical protein